MGYAHARPWNPRPAYHFTVESTGFPASGRARGGIGSLLYDRLFVLLRARGIHAVLGVVALPNGASVALHEGFGFRKVGQFEAVGFKFSRWVDVGDWQRVLQPTSGPPGPAVTPVSRHPAGQRRALLPPRSMRRASS